MAKRKTPVLGVAFNPDDRNESGRIECYISELEYYRPRGFSKLAAEGRKYVNAWSHFDKTGRLDVTYRGLAFADVGQHASEWQDECDSMLTDYARKVARHDYISFGPFEHGGAIGFYISTESAIEDSDLKVDDTSEIPRGFSGLVVQVSDHGNVTAYSYSRGKSRELFAVV